MTFANKELLARYLLGDLSAEDRQRLEREYLADDEVWENLVGVENDLIDSYVRGDLSTEQRRQFEQHFLDSPEKQERLEMAKLLMDGSVRQSIKKAPMPEQQHASWSGTPTELLWRRHRVINVVLGAAALAVFVVATVLILQNQHLRIELTRLQSDQTALRSQIGQLQQQITTLSNPQERNGGNTGNSDQHEPQTVAVLLTPRLPRGTGQGNSNNILRIPATASSVVLTLQMERDPYRQYEVLIETPEGNRVTRRQGLKSEAGKNSGRTISVHLPAQLLKKGDYILTLSGPKPGDGMEVVDSYSLSVLR